MMQSPERGAFENLRSWIGRSRELQDELTVPAVRRLLATLDLSPDTIGFGHGAAVPPHWLAILFDDAERQSLLGPDGHPEKGDFLPPVPLPRRMLAGRRITYDQPARIGDVLTRRSEIADIVPKTGRTGQLVFVTTRHVTRGPLGVVAVEEQDIAYREAAAGASPPDKTDPGPEAAWQVPFRPDPVLLFRYSALTFNGHRIHFDADYARDVEHYPDLVVNGGLTTLMLLEAASHAAGARRLRKTATRTLRPLFVARSVTLCGTAPDAEGRASLWVEDAEGAKLLRIEAEYVT